MPRQHPEPGDPEVQSREDLIRDRDRAATMLQETGSELAIMRGALFTAKGALQTVQDYLESVDSDAPHLPGVTVDTIVKHALESADKALG